jgi:hypothetical protein
MLAVPRRPTWQPPVATTVTLNPPTQPWWAASPSQPTLRYALHGPPTPHEKPRLVRILVLSRDQLQKVIDQAPKGFGTEPGKYHSDAIFLMDIPSDEAIKIFNPRDGVDAVWQGDLAIYSQRLSAQRTRSRLSKIMSSPLYKQMTIRSWVTTARLFELMNAMER